MQAATYQRPYPHPNKIYNTRNIMSSPSARDLPVLELDVDTMTESVRRKLGDSLSSFRLEDNIHEDDEASEDDYWPGDDRDHDKNAQEKLAQSKALKAQLERQQLAAKSGTKAVSRLRLLAFLVLLVTAMIVCIGVFWYTYQDEQADFEYIFESSAQRVMQSFHDSVCRLLVGMDALSVAITSYALDTNATFPFVTVPHMELRGASTRILTKSVATNYVPLVSDEDRLEWEAYATQKVLQENSPLKTFLQERTYVSRQDAMMGLDPAPFTLPNISNNEDNNLLLGNLNFSTQLFMVNGTVQPNHTGPYLPFYQTSPSLPAPSLPNLNILSFPPLAVGVPQVLAPPHHAYLGDALRGPLPPVFDMFLQLGQFRHTPKTFEGDAMTPFIYPVFDNFDEERTCVGLLFATIYWRLHLEGILPDNANGMIVVLSNTVASSTEEEEASHTNSTQQRTFTYQVNGPSVDYLGAGDLHDARYDPYEVSANISEFLMTHASVEGMAYTMVPLSGQDGSQYSISIYPSAQMEQDYITRKPMLYALVVGLVFLFTALVFLAYNILVERRQSIVIDAAIQSSAVVSNFFPDDVKEQLLEHTHNTMSMSFSSPTNSSGHGNSPRRSHSSLGRSNSSSTKWRLQEAAANATANKLSSPSSMSTVSTSTTPFYQPIAKKYENTTIMFAGKTSLTHAHPINKVRHDVLLIPAFLLFLFNTLLTLLDIAGFTAWSADREPEQVFQLLEAFYAEFDALAVLMDVFKVETIGDCYLAVTG